MTATHAHHEPSRVGTPTESSRSGTPTTSATVGEKLNLPNCLTFPASCCSLSAFDNHAEHNATRRHDMTNANTNTTPAITDDSDNTQDYYVDPSVAKKINAIMGKQRKSAQTMRDRLFDMGELMAVTKDEVFKGVTKEFGKWLARECPSVPDNYPAFVIDMYKRKAEVVKLCKDPKHAQKTSPQTIIRALRELDKPVPEATEAAEATDSPAKTSGGDAEDNAPSEGASVTLEGAGFVELMDIARAAMSRLYILRNGRTFDKSEIAELKAHQAVISEIIEREGV